MKWRTRLTVLIKRTTVLLAIAISFVAQPAFAADDMDLKHNKLFKELKFDKNLKIRGFKLSNGIYMGQAKVGGKYGFGVIVDRKRYFWGVNNKGISISKRF